MFETHCANSFDLATRVYAFAIICGDSKGVCGHCRMATRHEKLDFNTTVSKFLGILWKSAANFKVSAQDTQLWSVTGWEYKGRGKERPDSFRQGMHENPSLQHLTHGRP